MQFFTVSPKQSRILEMTCTVLIVSVIVLALVYQFNRWKLDGSALLVVGVLFVNFLNLMRGELGRASSRIDALEKRLAALESVKR